MEYDDRFYLVEGRVVYWLYRVYAIGGDLLVCRRITKRIVDDGIQSVDADPWNVIADKCITDTCPYDVNGSDLMNSLYSYIPYATGRSMHTLLSLSRALHDDALWP